MAKEGRSLVPPWFRRSFQLAERIAPDAASGWAMRLFFTPARRRARGVSRHLESGVRFSIASRRGPVVGWSWGQGDPVLLMHGWSGHAGQMAAMGEGIAGAGLRAICIDLPGHGRSAAGLSSLVHFADVVEDAARLFGPLRGLVAHSLGAGGATVALSRGNVSVERAVFLAPASNLEIFWARFRADLGMRGETWTAMRNKSERWLGLSFDQVQPIRLAPAMTTPLLVVHDADDHEIPLAESRALCAAWPGAALVETHGLGHAHILRDAAVRDRAVHFLTGGAELKSAA